VLKPDFSALELELGDLLDLVRVITLAPELPGSGDLIARLRDRGVIVSAGHTDATYQELADNQIARLTHFFNAMRPFHHRNPGAVGYGLAETVSLELIYDGAHVSREAAALAISCQEGRGRVMAVSDGTPMAGLRDGDERQMWGHRVRREAGTVRLEDGTLAGSGVTLVEVFQYIWRDFGSLRAVQMCSTHPREELSLPAPALWMLVGAEGNIIEILETDLEIS
jgi:N-acetylglucosamine-6-phosphate deacetylase